MLVALVLFLTIFVSPAFSACTDKCGTTEECQQIINECSQKLTELSRSKDTLSNQIKIITSQIELTQLKISQTESQISALIKEIASLTEKINTLDVHLNQLSSTLIDLVSQNYKTSKQNPAFTFLFTARLNDFLRRQKYLATIQQQVQQSLINLETARTNYDLQKEEKKKKQFELEDLQKKLTSQKSTLDKQKKDKAYLLEITKNDEKNYQKLKAAAEQELRAVLTAKFVGKRPVKKGEALGIMGNTGYSFGDHLHFGLYQLAESDVNSWVYQKDIDPMPYINSQQWPLNGTIRITQERGVTFFSKNYSDNFHHGVDMVSNVTTVVSVNDGVAYFYRNPQSSLGNHVKIFHPDGKMSLYLHLQ